MPANTRYRGTYYNTTETGTGSRTMKIEILDTEAVAGVTAIEILSVDEAFEGVSENFIPGVFPSTFKFQMAIRNAPFVKSGKTYGTSSDFITDLKTAPEGRFLVRLLIDDVFTFLGPLIIDQCTYENAAYPFSLSITAVDGITRLQSEPYVSEVGQIVYYSAEAVTLVWDTGTLLFDGPEATDWIVIEHRVWAEWTNAWKQVTTFARREIYSKTSPGSGWIDVGYGKWVKALDYTNEQEEEVTNDYYKLTRDIDNDLHRPVSEIFRRAMEATALTGEYPDPDVMYDVTMDWYEHDMADLTADPTTQMRIHEGPFLGKTWAEALKEVTRLLHMRIYGAQGRYHFEQISSRVDATIHRHIYKADGTSAGTAEDTDLDLVLSDLEIHPETGGSFGFLAPFSYVEAFLALDSSDLLEGVRWDVGQMGNKYLGRIKKTDDPQYMIVALQHNLTSTFDPSVLTPLNPNVVNSLCKHTIRTYIEIRITNVELGTTYWLNQGTTRGEWEITPYAFERTVFFGGPNSTFSADAYGHTLTQPFLMSAEVLPDPVGAMYDVHMSVTFAVEWDNSNALNLWAVLNPDKHWHILASQPQQPGTLVNSMKFYKDLGTLEESTDTIAQGKTYYVENDAANTLEVKVESKWGDTNQYEKAIQIWDGTIWKNSAAWSVGGAGDPVEILALLVTTIMSLRTVPRTIYTGAWITALPSPDNRLQWGTSYYLPMTCSRDTSFDTFRGDFVEIVQTTPPAVNVISQPDAGSPLPGQVGIGDSSPDSPVDPIDITLETDAAISSGATLTTVAIVNTAEAFIQAGTSVVIMHPSSGVQETVILTEDIDPTSTSMTFGSHTFAFSFPDAALIIPNVDDGLVPTSLAQYYYFYKEGYSASEIAAPNYNFPNPEGYGAQNINKRIKVFRNGIRIAYNGAPGSNPTKRKSSYYFDHILKKWKFWIPLASETIEIEAF